MKDIIYEIIIELSSAQEALIRAGELMDKLCQSQNKIEKHSYEAMNMTDTVLNLTRQGKKLVSQFKEGGGHHCINSGDEDKCNLILLLEEINQLFGKITEAAAKDNELLHSIETVAADQCGMTQELKNTIGIVNGTVDHAVACAEMIMTKDIN